MELPSVLAKNGSVLKKAAFASIPGRPSDVTGTSPSPHTRPLLQGAHCLWRRQLVLSSESSLQTSCINSTVQPRGQIWSPLCTVDFHTLGVYVPS